MQCVLPFLFVASAVTCLEVGDIRKGEIHRFKNRDRHSLVLKDGVGAEIIFTTFEEDGKLIFSLKRGARTFVRFLKRRVLK